MPNHDRRLLLRRFLRAGLPEGEDTHRPSIGYETAETAALRAVQPLLATTRPLTVLAGGVGTGKTVAMGWLAARWSWTCLYTNALYGDLPGFRSGPAWEAWLGSSLLLIDDMDPSVPTEKPWRELVASILEARALVGRPTVCSVGHLRPQDFARELLTETTRAALGPGPWWFSVFGPSFRGPDGGLSELPLVTDADGEPTRADWEASPRDVDWLSDFAD